MKILFADIDGVLNGKDWAVENIGRGNEDWSPYVFDPRTVRQLNRILEVTEAEIVISSSWRHAWTLEQLQKHFREQGVVGKVIDCTPKVCLAPSSTSILRDCPRGQEIQEWLDQASAVQPDVKWVFAILDDDTDMDPVKNRLVKTRFETGLTKAKADKVIVLLSET